MSGTPHAVKLVKDSPADDMDGGKFALIWWSPKDELFYVATKQSDTESSYVIYTTDGVAERVYVDQNQDSSYNVTETAATARFDQFSNTLYMSIDVACETQTNNIEPCLEKGDLIFITDANWGQDLNTQQNKAFFGADTVVDFAAGYADTTDLYTITKIWTAEETADTAVMCTAAKSSEWSCTVGDLYSGSYENKFRITVDKSINWDGSTLANPSTDSSVTTDSVYGYVQLLKFTPASTGNYEYVSMCSNRGLCNSDDGLCECFKGYTNDNCDTQSSLAV